MEPIIKYGVSVGCDFLKTKKGGIMGAKVQGEYIFTRELTWKDYLELAEKDLGILRERATDAVCGSQTVQQLSPQRLQQYCNITHAEAVARPVTRGETLESVRTMTTSEQIAFWEKAIITYVRAKTE